MRILMRHALPAILLLFIGSVALAEDFGAVDGVLTDKNNHPAMAVNVRLFSTQIGVQQPIRKVPGKESSFGSTEMGGAGQGKPIATAISSGDGKFQFPRIAVGNYLLVIAPTATTAAYQQKVTVTVNQTTHLTIQLGEPKTE